MTNNFKNTLIWLAAGTIAVVASMNAVSASYHLGEYVPVSNDSFYHARRILDTVEEPSEFFEFDDRIHVPEGSWITWPWFYDYATARLVRGVAAIVGADDARPILMYVPVFWAYVTIALILLISIELRLGLLYRLLACLAVALSPLTQMLHGAGLVDHHYMEYTFVLLTVLAGMRWFSDPKNIARAVFVGFVLGIAPGFHNAMFILQLPVLGGIYLLWFRGQRWQWREIGAFATGLITGVFLVLLPSEPFWEGFFEYYYLSWFHLYAAGSTVIAACLVANRQWSFKMLGVIVGVAVLLMIPLVHQALSMESFLAKDLARFDVILETKSPLELSLSNPRTWLIDFFSLLILLAPIVWVAAAWAIFCEKNPATLFFAIMVLFGLSLFFLQVRLHYFGSFAMILGPLLLATRLKRKLWKRSGWITAGVLLIYSGSYAGPVSNRLFRQLPLGLDAQYGLVQTVIPTLTEVCAEEPGVVLAYNDLGHYIRYHTECTVIGNNFLLTAQHERKIAEIDEMFSIDLPSLLGQRRDVSYIFVSYPFLLLDMPDGTQRVASQEDVAVMNGRWPLLVDLLQKDRPEYPGLAILREVRMREGDKNFAIVRLFRVLPSEDDGTPVDAPAAEETSPSQNQSGYGQENK